MRASSRVGDVLFDLRSPDEVLEEVLDTSRDASDGTSIHLANAYNVSLARHDESYRRVLTAGDLVLPDGKWVTLAVRLFTGCGAEQIRGADLFRFLLARPAGDGLRHFLLGSTPEVLDRLESAVAAEFPGARTVGTYAPPMGEPTEAERAIWRDRIRSTEANVVWLGLGTPRQDVEAVRLARLPGVTVVCVGAAFDFLAGVRREAPAPLRALGLEWLFRLANEPRRLWRRYLIGNSRFITIVGRQWLARRGRAQLLPE